MADAKKIIDIVEGCICHIPDSCFMLCPHVADDATEDCMENLLRDALEVMKSQQAEIERLQPKKGKWIEIESQTGVGAFGFNEVTVNAFRCSECRKKIDVSDGNFKYCPYCGADMRGGDGE